MQFLIVLREKKGGAQKKHRKKKEKNIKACLYLCTTTCTFEGTCRRYAVPLLVKDLELAHKEIEPKSSLRFELTSLRAYAQGNVLVWSRAKHVALPKCNVRIPGFRKGLFQAYCTDSFPCSPILLPSCLCINVHI